MLFNSAEFIVFFIITTIVYFLITYKLRPAWLLLASLYFYQTWSPQYTILLFLSILNHYLSGLMIAKYSRTALGKTVLILSICISLGLLFVFKYFNFFASVVGMNITRILLPIGISFYTFKGISYVVDVYRDQAKVQKNFTNFSLYMSFFPSLIAGPIDRAYHVVHQFAQKHDFSYQNAKNGLQLIVFGFLMKVVVADRLAVLVNHIYDSPTHYQGLPLLLATYFFAFQIYFDFAGYSLIAIGCARVLGIHLMNNFQRPYAATSLGDFWRRWHISLTSWFRDYLYIALGGNKGSFERTLFNMMVVFCLSGIWHGANWTFLLWGFFHGLFYCVERTVKNSQLKVTLPTVAKHLLVFHLVLFTWVLFRSNSLNDCIYILTHLLNFENSSMFLSQLAGMGQAEAILGLSKKEIILSIVLVATVLGIEQKMGDRNFDEWISSCKTWLRWMIYYALVASIFILGMFNSQEFIYFKY